MNIDRRRKNLDKCFIITHKDKGPAKSGTKKRPTMIIPLDGSSLCLLLARMKESVAKLKHYFS
jgi:hypothetical protein